MAMAQRSIGRDCLAFSRPDRKLLSLDDTAKLIDRQPITEFLALLYAAPKGEAAWPQFRMAAVVDVPGDVACGLA